MMEILIILAIVVALDVIARRRGHDGAANAAQRRTRRHRGVTSL